MVTSVPGDRSGAMSSAGHSGRTAPEGVSTVRLQGPAGQAHWDLG